MKIYFCICMQGSSCSSQKYFIIVCRIIRLCIDLYCKNPHVLDPLRKVLILPSNRTIR